MNWRREIRTRLPWATVLCALLMAGCGNDDNGSSGNAAPASAVCNASTGLTAALPTCSPGTPCTRIAPELGVSSIVTPTSVPACNAPWTQRFTHTVLGFTRHACVYRPPGTSAVSKRPMLLWFHPGGDGSADLAGSEAGLLTKAATYDLSGDAARLGFILVSVQGRNLRFPTREPRDGAHHDFYYRDLRSPSTNPDIANVDALIDTLAQDSTVDTSRIYVAGWSNGGFFSQLYAFARSNTPTTGGHRVAAASVFAAASPFAGISWDPFAEAAVSGGAACTPAAYPSADVPVLLVHRSADSAVACNAVQAACFGTEPGYTTTDWLTTASGAGLHVQGRMIGGLETGAAFDTHVAACTDYTGACPVGDCNTAPQSDACKSLVNHLRWPDGSYNNPPSGVDREIDMLQFLAANPRSTP